MSIFDNAKAKDMQRYVRDTILPPQAVCVTEATGRIKEYTTDRSKEWVVSLTVAQNFWANDVQVHTVLQTALRSIAATVYEDVLRELPRLRLAIESGDKAGAIDATFRIEKATQP